TRDELHHDEKDILLPLSREDGDDVRVIQARQEPWFTEELAEVEVLLVRNLERDLLVDPGVFREIDGPEASAANRLEDLVLPDQLSAEKHNAAEYTACAVVVSRKSRVDSQSSVGSLKSRVATRSQ